MFLPSWCRLNGPAPWKEQIDAAVEVQTAPEGPGTLLPGEEIHEPARRRRRRPSPTLFRFNSVPFVDWPSSLSLAVERTGQGRYEYRPQSRALLRWHVTARVRLFSPEQSRPPIALSRLTGRRRSYVFDVDPQSPADQQRRVHHDDCRRDHAQAYIRYSWTGCTEFEVDT